jgi:hypothetical protein
MMRLGRGLKSEKKLGSDRKYFGFLRGAMTIAIASFNRL